MPSITPAGIKNHHVSHSHPDVNGKWNGHLTWIVHYQPDNDDSIQSQRLEVYCHVGNYWDVGKWAWWPGASKMDVFVALRDLLDSDMSPKSIFGFARLLLSYRRYKKCQNET